MTFAVCLHAGAIARSTMGLHPSDRRAIALGRSVGAEIVVVEAVGERGSAPDAVGAGLAAGARRAIRIVDPALGEADAHSAGSALASVFDGLKVDIVLFGRDADPEGLATTPASIALHRAAMYLGDAIDLTRPGGGAFDRTGSPDSPAGAPITVTLRAGVWIRRVRLPANAVIGIGPGPSPDPVVPPATAEPVATEAGQPAIEVMSLADFKIDPASVRGRDDQRGISQPAHRPLVTLSSAAAVAAILRRQ